MSNFLRFVKKIRSNRGASAVEFAVTLPLLLTMLFGIIEFGTLLFDKAVLTNACREGARYGIVSSNPRRTNSEIKTVVRNFCAANLITFGAQNTPTVSVSYSSQNFGDNLTVTANYNYNFLVMDNIINALIGGVTLQAKTVMKYE